MTKYNMNADKPTLICLECGNTKDFDVFFNESRLEISYRDGRVPQVMEWADTGRDFEAVCIVCGSQDIAVDESFFE